MDDPRDKPGKRTVHLYVVCRVAVEVEDGKDDVDAIEKAFDRVDLDQAIKGGEGVYAEDDVDALVDHDGDEEHVFSTTYAPGPSGRWARREAK